MGLAGNPVAGHGQRQRRCLQGRVVGDSEAPIRAQASGAAVAQIPVAYAEQVRDLVVARHMLNQPAVA